MIVGGAVLVVHRLHVFIGLMGSDEIELVRFGDDVDLVSELILEPEDGVIAVFHSSLTEFTFELGDFDLLGDQGAVVVDTVCSALLGGRSKRTELVGV